MKTEDVPGKQIILLEVHVANPHAEPPGEWDWTTMVGDEVKILWAGDFVDG